MELYTVAGRGKFSLKILPPGKKTPRDSEIKIKPDQKSSSNEPVHSSKSSNTIVENFVGDSGRRKNFASERYKWLNKTCTHQFTSALVEFFCLIPPLKKEMKVAFVTCHSCFRRHTDECWNYHINLNNYLD